MNHDRQFKRFATSLEQSANQNFKFVLWDIGSLTQVWIKEKNWLLRAVLKLTMSKIKSEVRLRRLLLFLWALQPMSMASTLAQHFSQERTSAIVLSDHYCSIFHSLIVCAANQLGIRVFIVPFVIQDMRDICRARLQHKWVQDFTSSVMGRYVANRYPDWLSEHDDGAFLWAHPIEIMVLAKLNMLPKSPQQGITSFVEATLVPGSLEKKRLVDFGACQESVHVIGDIVAEAALKHKETPGPEFGKHPGVLWSVVPKLRDRNAYGSYFDYLSNYCVALHEFQGNGFSVRVCLHPSTTLQEREWRMLRHFEVLNSDIGVLLGDISVYLSSYTTTFLSAARLGIICVDDDIYKFDYMGLKEIEMIRSTSGGVRKEVSEIIAEQRSYRISWKAACCFRETKQSGSVLFNLLSHF